MSGGLMLFVVCVVVFTSIAAICDWRFKKLPNKLTVPAFVLGLVFHTVLGGVRGGWVGAGQQFLAALGGFAVGFGILLVLWLVGGGGGGDVKFMGALGAWLGPVLILAVLITSVVFVAVGSMAMLAMESSRLGMEGVRRRYFRAGNKSGGSSPKSRKATQDRAVRRRLLPYAVPVALATWTILAVSMLANLPSLSRLVGAVSG